MILPNIHKFIYGEDKVNTDSYQLAQRCNRKINAPSTERQVIFCPHFGTIFSWWIPESSIPDRLYYVWEMHGGWWNKLKHIDMKEGNGQNTSLWERGDIITQHHTNFLEMIDNQYDCYLVPMKDVYYSVCDGDGINFELFIEHDNTFYSTNITKKPDNFMVKSAAVRTGNNTFVGTLYCLDNNMLEYHYAGVDDNSLNGWTTVETDQQSNSDLTFEDYQGLSSGQRLDLPLEPVTPRNPPKENLMERFNKEAIDYTQEYSSSEEESEEETGNNTEDNIDDTSDEDYEPSDNSDDNSYDDYDDYDDYYDEKRQDLDGNWYTRRQFFDWYGSDEAWDNLDPSIYQQMRFDENCGQWHTKEEMFQWYGSNIVWKKMNPKKQFYRRRICDAYLWASSNLPVTLQSSFIREYLKSY